MFNNQTSPKILPSPLELLDVNSLTDVGMGKTFVKRDDLIHPTISGNKWRKLVGYFDELIADNQMVVSFGGPHSNHLHALAYHCLERQLKFRAIVQKRYETQPSPVINDIINWGGKIYWLKNSDFQYARGGVANCAEVLDTSPENLFFIPMGGAGDQSGSGIQEMVQEVRSQSNSQRYNWFVAAGTGATAAGMLSALTSEETLTVYLPFKRQKILDQVINHINGQLKGDAKQVNYIRTEDLDYGSLNQEVSDFIYHIYDKTDILFDPIYNGPLMYHLLQQPYLLNAGELPDLIVHTGGIQGWRGMYHRYKSNINFNPKMFESVPGL